MKTSEELERLRGVIERKVERTREVVRERGQATVKATMRKDAKAAAMAAETATFEEGQLHGLIWAEQILRMARLAAEEVERKGPFAGREISGVEEFRMSPSAKTLGGAPIEGQS